MSSRTIPWSTTPRDRGVGASDVRGTRRSRTPSHAACPEAFGERDARDAFALAATRLRDTKRHVYTRALETSRVLAGLGMRSEVIAAALLHGVMDADVVGVDEARARCGVEAASMAADAARLSPFSALARASADEAPLAEEDKRRFRSMLIAMTDARVVRLKPRSASWTWRMPTRHARPADEPRWRRRRRRKSVPLASRLGVWSLKARLEDACFLRLNPREHAALARELERDGRRASVADAVRDVAAALDGAGVRAERVYGRPVSLYGVHRKMAEKGLGLNDVAEVHDVRAVRVIVADEDACYAALDAVLRLPGYEPVPSRTKDYVARAKPNGYRSLHAVTTDARGRSCEVQIRTPEMHAAAEYGLASHWRYKEKIEEKTETEENTRQNEERRAFIDEQVRWARFALSWQGRLAHDAAARRAPRRGVRRRRRRRRRRERSVRARAVPVPVSDAQTGVREPRGQPSDGPGRRARALLQPRVRGLGELPGELFGEKKNDGVFFPPSDVVTVVAVVDGRMRVVDGARGARPSDVDLASLGGPGNARAAEFSSVVSVAVNREPVPPGAEVAGTTMRGRPRRGDARAWRRRTAGRPARREAHAPPPPRSARLRRRRRAAARVSATRWSPPTTWSPRRGSSFMTLV